jgi:hypothetical protein
MNHSWTRCFYLALRDPHYRISYDFVLKGLAVHPASSRMLSNCLRPPLSRANSALDNPTAPEHSKLCRSLRRQRSRLTDKGHRLDKLALQSRLPMRKLPHADA